MRHALGFLQALVCDAEPLLGPLLLGDIPEHTKHALDGSGFVAHGCLDGVNEAPLALVQIFLVKLLCRARLDDPLVVGTVFGPLHKDLLRDVVDDRLVHRLAEPQLLGSALAFRDVEAGAHEPRGLPVRIGDDVTTGVDVAPAAVAKLHPILRVVGSVFLQRRGDVPIDTLPVVGVQALDELRVAGDLRRGSIEQPEELG